MRTGQWEDYDKLFDMLGGFEKRDGIAPIAIERRNGNLARLLYEPQSEDREPLPEAAGIKQYAWDGIP